MDSLNKDELKTEATMEDIKVPDKKLKMHSIRKTWTMPERRRSQSKSSWVQTDLGRSSTYHLTRSRQLSYGGEDGFSCFQDNDLENFVQNRAGDPIKDEEKRWYVKWDEPNDPQNPRSMATARKWVIVLIMASSALCVYV